MIQIYLSELLAERQMTQAELSRLCGIRPSTISMIYNGLADRLNVHQLDKICGALDCNLSALLEYIPEKKQIRLSQNEISKNYIT